MIVLTNNLQQQWTPHIKETSTMRTKVPTYTLLYMQPPYCGNLPTLIYRLRITDTKVTLQWTKSIQISLWKWTVSTCYRCKGFEEYLLFLNSLGVSIHSSYCISRPLSDWKGSSHYWVHSLYKGHHSIMDTSVWSRYVCNSEILLECPTEQWISTC